MRVALDTNILVYAEGLNDDGRRDAARELVAQLPREETFLPLQALGELFRALRRQGGRTGEAARQSVLGWQDTFTTLATSHDVLLSAMDLACDHQFDIWDAVIVSTAADADCRLLLSEDMQDGFIWRGLTVVNPFASNRHPLLEAVLS